MAPFPKIWDKSGKHIKYPSLPREAEIVSQASKNFGHSLWEPLSVADKKLLPLTLRKYREQGDRTGLTKDRQKDRLGQWHSQE